MAKLYAKIGDVVLRNPFMLASGILDETAESMIHAYRDGAGAVVTKSVGSEPRNGYGNPAIVYNDFYAINAMGLPNPGVDEFVHELEKLNGRGITPVTSIFGSDSEEFSSIARKVEKYSTALELNLSCPHAKGLGAEIGSNREDLYRIVKAVKESVRIPVWAKLTPNIADIAEIGIAAEDAGADAVVAINTVRAMAIDINFRRPVLSNGTGGMSGRAIKPVAVAAVYRLKESLHIPVIGVGGIETIDDALEFLMAGASAVEIGTALIRHGTGLFYRLSAELNAYLEKNGAEGLSSIVGVAHRRDTE